MKKAIFIAAALVAGVALAATPPATSEPATPSADDTEITAAKPGAVKKCTGCHKKTLTGKTGKKKTPNIAGMSKAKLLTAMGHGIAADKIPESIKPAGKIPKAMKGVAKKLTDAQKAAIAAWISACKKEGCPE